MVMKEAVSEEPNFIKFEKVGDEFKGLYIGSKQSIKYNSIYSFMKDNQEWLLLGKTDLVDKMKVIPYGVDVHIVLKELVPTQKGDMKIFTVLFEDGVVEEEVVQTEEVEQ